MYDEVITVSGDDAFAVTARGSPPRRACWSASPPAPTCGPPVRSRVATVMAGKVVVTILCDTGERYLSTPLFADLPESKT